MLRWDHANWKHLPRTETGGDTAAVPDRKRPLSVSSRDERPPPALTHVRRHEQTHQKSRFCPLTSPNVGVFHQPCVRARTCTCEHAAWIRTSRTQRGRSEICRVQKNPDSINDCLCGSSSRRRQADRMGALTRSHTLTHALTHAHTCCSIIHQLSDQRCYLSATQHSFILAGWAGFPVARTLLIGAGITSGGVAKGKAPPPPV